MKLQSLILINTTMLNLDYIQQPFTPGDLVVRAKQEIGQLERLGIGAESALAVQSADPASWLRVWALARASGRPFMPLSPYLDKRGTLKQLHAAGAASLLHWDRKQKSLQRLMSVELSLTDYYQSSPALIVFSSGSEGEPRGVMHSAQGLQAASQAACERLGFGLGDLWLATLAPWHIGGIMILERALHCGGKVVVLEHFDPKRLSSLWHRFPVSHCSLVPTMLASLLEEPQAEPLPPTVRRLLIGGAALPQRLRDSALHRGWPLCVSYGLSEAGSQVATECNLSPATAAGEVGRLLSGMELALEDVEGGVGRIRIRGPMLMSGYLNEQRAPGQGLDDGGWFRTGDLGRWGSKGSLQVVGRWDDLIISAGVNVHPEPIERLLQNFPGVRDIVVLGVEDERYGQLVTVVVTGELEGDALLAWCREHLAGPQRPRRVVQVAQIPLLANGKIDRRQLRTWATQLLAEPTEQFNQ